MNRFFLLKGSVIFILFFFSAIGFVVLAELFNNWVNYLVLIQLFLIIWFIINIKLIENFLNNRFSEYDKTIYFLKEDSKKIEPARDETYEKLTEQARRIEELKLGLEDVTSFIELHKDEINNEIS